MEDKEFDEAVAKSLLPLDGERAVTFKDRGWPYTFYFPRLSQSDWELYFNGLVVEFETSGREQRRVVDIETSAAEMVRAKVQRVEGYQSKRDAPEDAEKWRAILPPGHLTAAGTLLRQVDQHDEDPDRPFDLEHREVMLRAAWGVAKPGSMNYYTGLVHRFRPPTAEHLRKYKRASAETRVVGGSRTGRTILRGQHKLLLTFYDELIAGVDGYSFGGRAIASAEEAKREMDALHKVEAVRVLFEAPEIEDPANAAREVKEEQAA